MAHRVGCNDHVVMSLSQPTAHVDGTWGGPTVDHNVHIIASLGWPTAAHGSMCIVSPSWPTIPPMVHLTTGVAVHLTAGVAVHLAVGCSLLSAYTIPHMAPLAIGRLYDPIYGRCATERYGQ